MGVFDRLFEAIASQPDLEWLMTDATVIRAQAQAAGARRKRGDLKPRLSAARVAGSAQTPCCRRCAWPAVRFEIGGINTTSRRLWAGRRAICRPGHR